MFITFEGIDFCGKSTQIKKLEEYLVSKHKIVKVIREPGGTLISEKIRDILLDKNNDLMVMETEILLFSASRAQLVREKIKPYLDNGFYVISDRFHDSSTAYQGYGRGLSVDAIKSIHKIAIGETVPDITFLIDIPIEIAHQRKSVKSGELDRIEMSDINFYNRVRDGYLQIAKEEKRFRVIDGNRNVDIIHKDIILEILEHDKLELL
ncbi:MAG: dTMP kinase [Ignavibacteriaceae bacterium]|nr:dTMP kinase [Ignavibacteriaceae bacterium]